MSKISVIIPVYNGEKTIQETIESVLAQTFTDFELIIINDGSTDETLEVISKFLDHRIKVFSYSNRGLSASRNRGVQQSQGQYISFIDADDLWTKDKLEKQHEVLEHSPIAKVAYSGTSRIDEQGKFLYDIPVAGLRGDVYAYLLLRDIVGSGSNPLIDRQTLLATSDFDESLRAAEDWDLWIRLAARCEFIDVPLHQIFYRRSPNSMSSQITRQEQETLKVIKKAFATAPRNLQYLRKGSLINVYISLIFKCVEENPTQGKGLKGLELMMKMLVYGLKPLKYRATWKVIARLLVITFFPPRQAVRVLNRLPRLYGIANFFNNMITDI